MCSKLFRLVRPAPGQGAEHVSSRLADGWRRPAVVGEVATAPLNTCHCGGVAGLCAASVLGAAAVLCEWLLSRSMSNALVDSKSATSSAHVDLCKLAYSSRQALSQPCCAFTPVHSHVQQHVCVSWWCIAWQLPCMAFLAWLAGEHMWSWRWLIVNIVLSRQLDVFW